MINLMRLGGWPMWFILGFGLTALYGGLRFALDPVPRRLLFAQAMAAATLFSTAMGTALDVGATLAAVLGKPAWRSDPQWYFILLQGLAESLSPPILGFAILAQVAILVAVGVRRDR